MFSSSVNTIDTNKHMKMFISSQLNSEATKQTSATYHAAGVEHKITIKQKLYSITAVYLHTPDPSLHCYEMFFSSITSLFIVKKWDSFIYPSEATFLFISTVN